MRNQKTFNRSSIFFPFLLAILWGCAGLRDFSGQVKINSELRKNDLLSKHFVGLAIYDEVTQRYLFQKNSSKYFTPASNTKLLTFYAALNSLDDTLTGLLYNFQNDTLFIKGAGDPSFLHPDFNDQPILDFLKSQSDSVPMVLIDESLRDRFGPGWAWDDYNYHFQPEISAFPIYGNMLTAQIDFDSLIVNPPVFRGLVEIDSTIGAYNYRDENYNVFHISYDKLRDGEVRLPFKPSIHLTRDLLADKLQRQVLIANRSIKNWTALPSVSTRKMLAIMMKRSDNFFAEQLLLMSCNTEGFSWNTPKFMNHFQKKFLNDLPQRPIWKDGSGLSRYNLVTPEGMVVLLRKIKDKIGFETARQLLPVGGVSGTIKNWYEADQPYVFAKTGTLSNNHNLSGYLLTKSGKTLIFSFMNNNYPGTSGEVKKEMQKVLEFVRDHY